MKQVSVDVTVGNGRRVNCTKRGDVLISNGAKHLKLTRVLYAPTFSKNIISIGLLCDKNARDNSIVTWTSSGMNLKTKQGGELNFKKEGVLHYFEGTRTPVSTVMSAEVCDNNENAVTELPADVPTSESTKTSTNKKRNVTIDINQAHEKYGHVSEAALRATLKSINVPPYWKTTFM